MDKGYIKIECDHLFGVNFLATKLSVEVLEMGDFSLTSVKLR